MGLSLKLSDVAFVLSSIEGRCGGHQFARNWHSNDTEILGLWGEERAGSYRSNLKRPLWFGPLKFLIKATLQQSLPR